MAKGCDETLSRVPLRVSPDALPAPPPGVLGGPVQHLVRVHPERDRPAGQCRSVLSYTSKGSVNSSNFWCVVLGVAFEQLTFVHSNKTADAPAVPE